MTPPRWAVVAGVLLVGLVIGLGVAVGSSLSSLSPDRHGETAGFVQPSPSPLPTPSPTVKTPGILGASGRLVTNGSNTVIATVGSQAIGSADGGRTWIVVVAPPINSGLAIDSANPRHAITGGATIQYTNDGVAWAPALNPPPGKGPYQPLAISSLEPNVWLFAHQGRLLVTRDGSATWSESSVPQLSNPIVVPGQALGQFYLASGNRVFQLASYGQSVTEQPAVAQGAVTEMAVVSGNHPTLLVRVAGHGDYLLTGSSWQATGGSFSGPVAAGGNGTILVGNGGAKLGSPGLISYSTNGGATWVPGSGLPSDQTVEAIAGHAGSATFFAYCYGGDLYVSNDGGGSWALVSHAMRAGTG
jgi:hypothetical protein